MCLLGLLPWQVDSLPLHHLGSPYNFVITPNKEEVLAKRDFIPILPLFLPSFFHGFLAFL